MAETSDGQIVAIGPDIIDKIRNIFEEMSRKGFRVLGLCYKVMDSSTEQLTRENENPCTFVGFIILGDPIRPGVNKSIHNLERLGISLKMISGDNRLIASHVSEMVGMSGSKLLVGLEVDRLTSDALVKRVNEVDVFAEIEPRQKERIILALKKAGNVVGYMGDGVNDTPALHAADVGISVSNASDIVKEEADLVLLHKSLDVLAEGIREGRRTFVNTLKYVFMATSANFGNMFSTAVASFFLPFLPMLPKQILLTNLLTDTSEMMIATDAVDTSILQRPRRWDIGFIRKFMTVFGTLSAVFDFATFGILMLLLRASVEQFRTAWFIESVVSASLVVLIVRSQKPLHRSRPSKYLVLATVLVATIAATVIPLTPIGAIFDLVILPPHFYAWIVTIVVLYLASAESLKILFYRKNMRSK